MKKWIISLIIILTMISIVAGIEECQTTQEPTDIPCRVTSTWDYPNDCNTYNVAIYNTTGDLIIIKSLGNLGSYCNFTFNYSEKGSYYFNVTSGDTGSILVEDKNMSLALVIGIGIVAALLLWLSFNLDPEHFALKIMLIIVSIIALMLVPLAVTSELTTAGTFYRLYMFLFVFFWLYVGVYFVWWIFTKMRKEIQT